MIGRTKLPKDVHILILRIVNMLGHVPTELSLLFRWPWDWGDSLGCLGDPNARPQCIFITVKMDEEGRRENQRHMQL